MNNHSWYFQRSKTDLVNVNYFALNLHFKELKKKCASCKLTTLLSRHSVADQPIPLENPLHIRPCFKKKRLCFQGWTPLVKQREHPPFLSNVHIFWKLTSLLTSGHSFHSNLNCPVNKHFHTLNLSTCYKKYSNPES